MGKYLTRHKRTFWIRCSKWQDIATIKAGCSDERRKLCTERKECADSFFREHKDCNADFLCCHKYEKFVSIKQLD